MKRNPKVARYVPVPPDVERVGKIVLDSAFQVHSGLGPGLLESVYETCLAYEIRNKNVPVQTQVILPVIYKDVRIETGLRIDLLVNECVVFEVKSVDRWNTIYEAQILTYLKLTGIRLGFLLNFNVLHLRDGIKRMIC